MRFSVNYDGARRGQWVIAIICLMFIGAAPADKFNLAGQHRTRSCVKMKMAAVPLRFADGRPTGFFVRADDPSKQGGKRPCSEGFMEIDAHETLTTAGGETLYFHPGGGGDHYKDPVENGQYGHIAATDLAAAPKLKRSENGKAATASGARYYIAPTRIPHDMWYKADVVKGRSGSSYLTYGNPGYDKTFGRGDWTYITWSWVQNGGSTYPENVNGGGGIVRALAKRDDRFMAAAAGPIIGYSYGADNRTNGRVTVIYGNTNAGAGGSPIYGWLVHSYQRQNEPIVPCTRRAAAPPNDNITASTPAQANEEDPMVRMARNLLSELRVDAAAAPKMRDDWRKCLREEQSSFARMEVLTEMSRVDDAQTITDMLELLAKEQNGRVREQVILLLPYMRSTAADVKRVCDGLLKDFRRSSDKQERLRIIDAAAIIPARESVDLLREIVKILRPGEEDVELRFGAADGVFRLMLRMKVDDQLADQVRAELKTFARQGSFATRARAVRALAAPAWNEQDFLVGLERSEMSPVIRDLITKMTSKPEPTR
jgi:hypothetical protein